MRPRVFTLPKAVGPRVAEAINSNANALADTIAQVQVLTTLTAPLARPFLGRLKWLLFGK